MDSVRRASVNDEVTTLSAEMLRRFCEANDYRYSSDKAGNIRLSFDHSEERDSVLKVHIDCSGKSGTVLCVRITSDRRYDADRMDEVLRAINEYHIEKRWPKVYAEVKGKAILITCETQLDATVGIHQALLDETISRALSSSNTFHKWMVARNIPARA